MKVLLDTCTFLWIVSGARELSARARDAFQDPDNEVYLSVVSSWEIGIKAALGRLKLSGPPAEVIPSLRDAHRIDCLVLDEPSTLHLVNLPAIHGDPFDRMLVCQALIHGMTILTPDEAIRRYAVPTRW